MTSWESHAILERKARLLKGRKVVSVIERQLSLTGCSVLDVGTGGGYIAECFQEVVGSNGRVVGADRSRQLPADSTVEYAEINGDQLPFDDASFDVVVSNHVVPHVGPWAAQLRHVAELGRVVRPGGLVFLATPNRWGPFEPNFRVPLLSWWPQFMRNLIVRALGRGESFDVAPLTRPALQRLFRDAGLHPEDVTHEAIRAYSNIEAQGAILPRLLGSLPEMPRRLIAGLFFIPSFLFIARKPKSL